LIDAVVKGVEGAGRVLDVRCKALHHVSPATAALRSDGKVG
jgi:hypothetical protein